VAIKRITGTFSRPADNTAYAAGDAIANSTTASLVVPIEFNLQGYSYGNITGARCVVTPASGNLVITALEFELLLFRPVADIPFAAGSFAADNAALTVSAAAYREAVGIFTFDSTQWRSPAGSLSVAGVTGFQSVDCASRPFYPFNLETGITLAQRTKLVGIVQALDAWTPTGVINQFDFALDVDVY
jgi:hypothetical protein